MATRKRRSTKTKEPVVEPTSLVGEMSQDVATSTVVDTSIIDKVFSLNQKRETFLGIGRFWLSPDNYSFTVPSDVTKEETAKIRKAISNGILLEGEKYIPPIDKDQSVLDEYWHLLKTYGLDTNNTKSESTIQFRKIFKNGTDRNWTAKEVAKYCIKKETEYKNRDKIIKLLQDMHKYSSCPDTLLESR